MIQTCRHLNCIVPPHLLRKLLESKDREISEAALNTLLSSAQMRGAREVLSIAGFLAVPGHGRRTIYDCNHGRDVANSPTARSEDGKPASDNSVNQAFDGLGKTRDFYQNVFARDSLDGRGMRLDAFVHFSNKYNNAFWDGQRMMFGDGDGLMFTDLTKSLDVIAHELTHGVTNFTAGLEYHLESGALNESISDVMGSLVKQNFLNQTADQADWLIGAEIWTPGIEADALRSLKAPGTAYDNALFGKDPQPDHMDKWVHLPDTELGDNGGVHYNSGIPNKAFFLTAKAIGGRAWESPGHIWYESLLASNQSTDFQGFADTTFAKAGQLYGTGSTQQKAVAEAWREVGIRIVSARAGLAEGAMVTTSDEILATLTKQITALVAEIKALQLEVKALKK